MTRMFHPDRKDAIRETMAAPIPLPKTTKNTADYLHDVVKLKLHFLHGWLQRHPEESFVDALRNRVDIYRKTDINPGGLNPPNITGRNQHGWTGKTGCGDLCGLPERR